MKGYKFTWQKPIGNYIVDFFCNRLRLVIEVGGITHENNEDKDFISQRNLEKMGLRFLRFLDSDVGDNISGYFGTLWGRVSIATGSANPSAFTLLIAFVTAF